MSRVTNLVIIAAAVATAVGAVVLALRDTDTGQPIEIIPPSAAQATTAPQSSELKVYLTGAVQRPGLYIAKDGDRLAEVIDLAGGATEDADLLSVNLAIRVKDQDHWHIPKMGEQPPPQSTAVQSPAPNGKIDINSAEAKLLETLPGIGEVRAQSIVQYREENGPFKRIEDILGVSGVGPATLEGLRDLIEVR